MRVRLLKGCLVARSTSAAVVTSANPYLVGEANTNYWQFAGRSSADGVVRHAAGRVVLDELELLPGLPLGLGQVATTRGGELSDTLVHVCAPDRLYGGTTPDGTTGVELLTGCFTGALRAAEAANACSIAMPAIGCGVRGWPPSLSAKIALASLIEHAVSPRRKLTVCEIVLHDAHAYRAWVGVAQSGLIEPGLIELEIEE
jgi:O-acetyl-ADP-ribose deacetylase (regulator of RNase III)